MRGMTYGPITRQADLNTTTDPRGTVWLIFAGGIATQILTIGIARFAYTPLLPVMRAQAGLDAAGAGWLGAMIYLGYFAGTVVLSFLRRPAHRLWVFRAGLLLAVATTFQMGETTSLWHWSLSRVLAGFSGVAGMLLAAEFILFWLRDHGRRPDLGPHFAGIGIGICLSGVIAWAMGAGSPWDWQWRGFGWVALVLLPLAWALVPAPAAAVARGQGSAVRIEDTETRRWFWLFGGGYLAAGWTYAVGATFVVDILTSAGSTGGTAAMAWVLLGLSNMVGAVAGSLIARRLGSRPVLLSCMLAQALSLAALTVPGATALHVVAAVLFGATFVVVVSLSLMEAGLRRPSAPGTAMARMTLMFGIGQIAGPIATGWLAGPAASYAVPLVLGSLMALLGTLSMFAAGK